MSMIRAIIRTGFAVAIVGMLGVAALAQERPVRTPNLDSQDSARPESRRQGEGMKRRGHRGGAMRGLRQLNLSDTQRQQMHDLFTKTAAGIKPQREELRQIRQKFEQATATTEDQTRAQALRQQIRASREQAITEAQSFLSPEQQEQLRQAREQKKLRREEMKQRRGGRGGQDTPPVQ